MDLVTEQRRARRDRILDVARVMIAEVGYEAVTVRGLAERCRVSVPTLYNQFGGKDRLLGEAISRHVFAGLDEPALPGSRAGLTRLLQVIERSGERLLEQREYHRRLLQAFAAVEQTAEISLGVAAAFSERLAGELAAMQSRGQIRPWVELAPLANQLTSGCIGAVMGWSGGLLDDARLVPSLRYMAALVLAGVTSGAAQRRLLSVLRESQEPLRRGDFQNARPPSVRAGRSGPG